MSRPAGGSHPSSLDGGRLRWQMRLPLPVMLAFRYLRSGRRDAYVSLLSLLAVGGITLGVGALILVLAGLSGLQDFLRSDVLSRTPHLEVELPLGTDTQEWVGVLAAHPGVVDVQRLLRGRGWLVMGQGAVDVRVVGYEGRLPRFFPGVVTGSVESKFEPNSEAVPGRGSEGLYLGDGLAVRWGIAFGDPVEIVSPRPTLTPLGPQPRAHQMRLKGTFRTGRTEDDDPRIAIPLAVASRLFGQGEMRLELTAESLDAALALGQSILPQLPEGSRVKTWQDLNRGLFFALKLEKMLMFISVFLIVPVAGMSLVTVLALLISSKRGEIGMLRTMGAQPQELRRAFLALGGLLVMTGLFVGTMLGITGAWLLDYYRVLTPPGDLYFIDHIPFLILPQDVLRVLGATALLTFLSTVYAARKAAATPVVEVLRS